MTTDVQYAEAELAEMRRRLANKNNSDAERELATNRIAACEAYLANPVDAFKTDWIWYRA